MSASQKSCDIIYLGRLSEPEISDSISQIWHIFWYIENIQIWTEFVISPYPQVKLTGSYWNLQNMQYALYAK